MLAVEEASKPTGVLGTRTTFGLPRLRFKNIELTAAISWVVLIAVSAICAPLLPLKAPYAMDFAAAEHGPSLAHLLGADVDGRDILSRVIFGARTSLTVALIGPTFGLVVGSMFGILTAYYGGLFRAVMLGLMDGILAFPGFVLALALTTFLGASVVNVAIALGILSVPAFARVARANALPLVGREFVLAARTAGASDLYILTREILPNMGAQLLTYALTVMSVMIVIEGGLSFLGVGLPPPIPSWGNMIADGREALDRAPQIAAIPAFALFLTVLSVNVIGDHLRRRVEVREGAL
jgi:ABC-type dipeptide/oligopeptide/nickel transport system permease subunit